MKGNVLRTNSCTFAAVCASARNVEGTDKVEHILLEGVGSGSLSDTGVGVIEYAVFTGAGRTYISACVAADALGKLASPEVVALVGSHCFQLFNKLKACAVGIYFAVVSDHLIENNVLLALAGLALVAESFGLGHCLVAVKSVDSNGLAVALHACDTLDTLGLNGISVNLACALNADDINVVTEDPVLFKELIEAVCIAGLEEYQELALLAGFLYQVL